ncbi:unnamed protein product, partial [Iphiclides podalirius]
MSNYTLKRVCASYDKSHASTAPIVEHSGHSVAPDVIRWEIPREWRRGGGLQPALEHRPFVVALDGQLDVGRARVIGPGPVPSWARVFTRDASRIHSVAARGVARPSERLSSEF